MPGKTMLVMLDLGIVGAGIIAVVTGDTFIKILGVGVIARGLFNVWEDTRGLKS